MNDIRLLLKSDLGRLLRSLAPRFRVFAPLDCNGDLGYASFPFPEERLRVANARTVEPLKAFFFPARQKVADGFQPLPFGAEPKPLCLVGVKACDLRARDTLDFVFHGPEGAPDPFYAKVQRNTLIISADCTEPRDTCFCPALDGEPFCRSGFDLNLSPVEEGYVVEVGSSRGGDLLAEHADLFQPVEESHIVARDEARRQSRRRLQENLEAHGIPHQSAFAGAVHRASDSPIWEEEARACVECGACNTICPTCHCFLIYDQGNDRKFARFRTWDACLLKDFTRVAGGGNPRPRLWMRLRNRFVKKFDFFPKVAGSNACTGCGRCIEACPARIDIRRVLRKVATDDARTESLSAH
jgi:sulfhydrogenase subunit beta (sulfur reductase)